MQDVGGSRRPVPRDRQGWSVRVVLLIALAGIGLVVTMLFVAVSSGIERPAEQSPSGTAATTDPSSDHTVRAAAPRLRRPRMSRRVLPTDPTA